RALEREVFALMLGHLAAEELRDDLDRLEHHRRADADLGPLTADDVLVERLACSQAEPEPAREHRAEGRGRMCDHGGAIAEAGAGHGRPERERRAQPERAHERPREAGLALLRGPRMEVLGDHETGLETGAF